MITSSISMVKKTYYLQTFGCQANKADSERIAADYQARAYHAAENWQNCDELIINTCAVRARVEDKVKGFLHNVEQYFSQAEKSKQPKIILTGCMLYHDLKQLKKTLPIVDKFLPISEVAFNHPAVRQDKKHAFIQISEGCNSFCSYCVVPLARGREKSRSMAAILKEIKTLIKQGYQEFTLLGQNVNSWGLEKIGIAHRKMWMRKKLSPDQLPDNATQYFPAKGISPFVKLIRAISQFPQVKIIRFYAANPWDFRDDLINEIGQNQKIDRFVHIPIQSASNSVLKRMNRGYTRENYAQIVKKLRKADPKITLGTDLIVGFPHESDQEFQETVDFANRIKWQLAFVNIYSPRPGTAADKFYQDDIPHQKKKERWLILDKLINQKNLRNRPKIV